jgi:hypothetical protein
MSFKFSLYCVPKETVEKYRNITQEEFDESDTILDELKSDCIRYDTLTDVLIHDNDDRLSSRLFTNRLDIEDDMSFETISKQQFLNIIEEVRVNHILKWFDGRRVDGPESKHLGEYWKGHPSRPKYRPEYFKPSESDKPLIWTAEDALLANQCEWNIKARQWNYRFYNEQKKDYQVFNLDLDMDNKWAITNGFTYEYLIFELVHILKIFDWENDVMVAIGG